MVAVLEQPTPARFGTVFAEKMAVARFRDGAWTPAAMEPVRPLELHPAAHVLHYSSTVFEGLKAYRWRNGSVHAFRMDRHIARLRRQFCIVLGQQAEVGNWIIGKGVDAER